MLFLLLKDFFHKYMQGAFHKENYSEVGENVCTCSLHVATHTREGKPT